MFCALSSLVQNNENAKVSEFDYLFSARTITPTRTISAVVSIVLMHYNNGFKLRATYSNESDFDRGRFGLFLFCYYDECLGGIEEL